MSPLLHRRLIAEGWFRRASPAWLSPRSADNLKVILDVTRSLKGDVPDPLIFFGVTNSPAGWWSDATNTCGALPSDLTGRYELIIFQRDRNGELYTNRVMGACFATGPDDESITRFRRYIDERLEDHTSSVIVPGPADDLTWFPGIARLLTLTVVGSVVIALQSLLARHLVTISDRHEVCASLCGRCSDGQAEEGT